MADTFNNTIREIDSAGIVRTLAGSAELPPGSDDGPGSAARFSLPEGVAADGSGNVYVADTANHTIRMISSTGMVTTIAGRTGTPDGSDGTGGGARFNSP